MIGILHAGDFSRFRGFSRNRFVSLPGELRDAGCGSTVRDDCARCYLEICALRE
jgi:hypothetical protein